ncbi:MAG: PPOX class F420-dependent oxidoreductase [Candidatus Caldarchaeum sp.]|uniref:PPOX class F420-dependent oxidoreductase n=1 Tax=Caldiarchaeum subterraneum TaxID=311458 RepID=A0A7C5L966_CALS0
MVLDSGVLELLRGRNFGFLATVNKDGSPQVSPVWIDEENGYILVNTVEDRVKVSNTRKDPRVSLAIPDSQNPYRYAYVKGRVVDYVFGDKAEEHIDKLAIKYTGEKFKWRTPGDRRVIMKIKPEKTRLL